MDNTNNFIASKNKENYMENIMPLIRLSFPTVGQLCKSITNNKVDNRRGRVIIDHLQEEYSKIMYNQLWDVNAIDAVNLGEKERYLTTVLYRIYKIFIDAEHSTDIDDVSINSIINDKDIFKEFTSKRLSL